MKTKRPSMQQNWHPDHQMPTPQFEGTEMDPAQEGMPIAKADAFKMGNRMVSEA